MKFASVSFYCQVSDTGSVGWASSFYLEKYLANIDFWNQKINSCDIEKFDIKIFELWLINILEGIQIYWMDFKYQFRYQDHCTEFRVTVMVFNTTFSSFSVILWQSVLFKKEVEEIRENHRFTAGHWQTLSYNVVWSTSRRPWVGFGLTTLVVIDTDCRGKCKFNYHTITSRQSLNYAAMGKVKNLLYNRRWKYISNIILHVW